jgi:hypothetical protein
VRHAARADKNFAFFNLDGLASLALRLDDKLHLTLDLVKKLVPRIDMEIEPRIRPAQHHDNKILMADQQLVRAKRRIEQMLVLVDPLL